LDEEIDSDGGSNEGRQKGRFADEFLKALEAMADGFDAPRGEKGDGRQGEAESRAERGDEAHAEPRFLQLETGDENDDGGGAGGESATQAKKNDLAGGDFTIGKVLGDFAGVMAGVGVIAKIERRDVEFFLMCVGVGVIVSMAVIVRMRVVRMLMFVRVAVIVRVIMSMIVRMMMGGLVVVMMVVVVRAVEPVELPEHPVRDEEDDDARD